MYSTWVLLVLLLLKLDTSTFGILFEYRLRCPDTKEKWEENTNSYNCHGDTVYQCMQNQDGRFVIFCASSIWIESDYCPEFNEKASLIDVILCQGNVDGCPEKQYLSNTVYQYPSCFRTVIRSTRPSPPSVDRNVAATINPGNPRQPKQDSDGERNSTDSTAVIWGIIVGTVLPILVFFAITFLVKWRILKTKKKASHDEKGERIKALNDKEETQSLLMNSRRNNNERESGSEAFNRPGLYDNAVRTLKEDGFIIIVGGPGSGKTTLAHFIVNKELTDYCVFHMKPKQRELPKFTGDKNEAVIWDDCFGIWNVCDLEENMNASVRNTIFDLIKRCKSKAKCKEKCKALICIDPFFDKAGLFVHFGMNVIDLADNYRAHFEKEKLTKQFDRKIYTSKASEDVGFPLLITLILEHHCPIEKAEQFLEKPKTILCDNFSDIFENEKDTYATLVYVLCNSPSVNLRDINWKSWIRLREECQNRRDGDNNKLQKNDKDSQMKEANHLSEKSNIILRKPEGIAINTILAKYLVETEDPDVFRFRHHFLEHLLLCYHMDKVGNKGVLEEGNEEIRSVVKKLQSPSSNPTPVKPVHCEFSHAIVTHIDD